MDDDGKPQDANLDEAIDTFRRAIAILRFEGRSEVFIRGWLLIRCISIIGNLHGPEAANKRVAEIMRSGDDSDA